MTTPHGHEAEGRGGRRVLSSDQREQRMRLANAFLLIISQHGRQFFRHGDVVCRFDLGCRNRVWFIDSYTGARIYTSYRRGRWSGFTGGGTLRDLVERLADYITGKRDTLPLGALGPWPAEMCGGDLWGYGEAMATVRAECSALVASQIQPPASESAARKDGGR